MVLRKHQALGQWEGFVELARKKVAEYPCILKQNTTKKAARLYLFLFKYVLYHFGKLSTEKLVPWNAPRACIAKSISSSKFWSAIMSSDGRTFFM